MLSGSEKCIHISLRSKTSLRKLVMRVESDSCFRDSVGHGLLLASYIRRRNEDDFTYRVSSLFLVDKDFLSLDEMDT